VTVMRTVDDLWAQLRAEAARDSQLLAMLPCEELFICHGIGPTISRAAPRRMCQRRLDSRPSRSLRWSRSTIEWGS
jgi:hypothetical protein